MKDNNHKRYLHPDLREVPAQDIANCQKAKICETEQKFYVEFGIGHDAGNIRLGCICEACLVCTDKEDSRTGFYSPEEILQAVKEWNLLNSIIEDTEV